MPLVIRPMASKTPSLRAMLTRKQMLPEVKVEIEERTAAVAAVVAEVAVAEEMVVTDPLVKVLTDLLVKVETEPTEVLAPKAVIADPVPKAETDPTEVLALRVEKEDLEEASEEVTDLELS